MSNRKKKYPKPNPGKKLVVKVGGVKYARYPIRTHIVSRQEKLEDVVDQYAGRFINQGDILVISERIVAVVQGRSFLIKEIKPSPLATFLSKHVSKHPGGIGLKSPWTMELAIQEVGWPRIFLAAAVSAVTKPFGIRGVFYHLAGHDVATIDGPCDYTLPPGNKSAKLGPKNPDQVAKKIAARFGVETVIIDANDYGTKVLGASKGVEAKKIEKVFLDNPLGQADEQTPIAIVREVN